MSNAPATHTGSITDRATIEKIVGPVTNNFMVMLAGIYGAGPSLPEKYHGPIPEGGTIINQGGTYSGKTETMCQLAAYLMCIMPGVEIFYAGKNIPHLKRDAYKTFHKDTLMRGELPKAIPKKKGLWNQQDRSFIAPSTGATIVFGSLDISNAHGPKPDILLIDEAYYMPEEVYKQASGRAKKFTIASYNPVSEFWAHRIIHLPDVRFFRTTYKDNEFCPPRKIEQIEAWKTADPPRYTVYGLGKKGRVDGLVFNWHVTPLPEGAKLVGYGIDFGYNPDPTAMVAVYRAGNDVWIDQLVYENDLRASQVATRVKQIYAQHGTAQTYADGGGLGKTILAELVANGLPVMGAKKDAGSVLGGVEIMKEYTLHITPRSNDLNDELNSYFWPKNDLGQEKQGNPVGKDDHLIDAARYVFLMALSQARGAATSTFTATVNVNNANY